MTRTLLLALLAAGVAAGSADHPRDRQKECEAVKKEIRKVHARLRRGYRAAEGVRLDAKLLELRKQRAKLCR